MAGRQDPTPTEDSIEASQSRTQARVREATGFAVNLSKILPRCLDNASLAWYTELKGQPSSGLAGSRKRPDCQPTIQCRIEEEP